MENKIKSREDFIPLTIWDSEKNSSLRLASALVRGYMKDDKMQIRWAALP